MPLKEVLGHRRLVALIARSVSRDALPPSLIFSGPPGVGKKLTAVAAAQLLNCTARVGEGVSIDACGVCRSCTRIARGVHSDVIIVEPGDSGSIKIEQIRDIVERTAYRPFEGRCRVVIIDAAEALVVQAQNALLKTLEEPPAASVFVLVTAQPDLLLPTVRSRCRSCGSARCRCRTWSPCWCATAEARPRRGWWRRRRTGVCSARSNRWRETWPKGAMSRSRCCCMRRRRPSRGGGSTARKIWWPARAAGAAIASSWRCT